MSEPTRVPVFSDVYADDITGGLDAEYLITSPIGTTLVYSPEDLARAVALFAPAGAYQVYARDRSFERPTPAPAPAPAPATPPAPAPAPPTPQPAGA